MKVGIDILEIERISEKAKFLDKVLLENEKNYIQKYANPSERIAGVFCAKEAVFKALDIDSFNYLEIEISHKENGRPIVILYGKLKEYFNSNYKEIDISISHSKTVATAICVIS